MKARAFSDLKSMQTLLRNQVRAAQEASQARALAEEQARRERHLFELTVGHVKPIKDTGRAAKATTPVAPTPKQRDSDNATVMTAALSDDFDVTSLLETDEALSYRRSGIGDDVMRKLRGGYWALQGEVDLHGLRSDEAREALAGFLRKSVTNGWRCVRVIHGKGLGSPGKAPVLKIKTQRWLVQKKEVVAFVQARGCDGGAGALMVLLKSASN
jgi:DNA-nicking Smr family endonuclease